MKAKYDISGMNCAACSAAVERAVRSLGIDEVSVNLLSGTMNVEFDESSINDSDIRNAVKKAGFGIDAAKSSAEKRRILQESAIKNERSLFRRLISSTVIMLILMYFSMGHMLGLPLPAYFAKPIVLAIIQFVLTIPILIINRAYFSNGFRHLFAKTPNMDSLIAVGSSAAVIYGIFAIIQIILGNEHYLHDLYFETAAMIPTLVTVGKFLEEKSRSGTGKALDMLIDLTPKKAVIIENGTEKEVDIEHLKVGDTVIIKPGQSVPCDGEIIGGESYIDESSLTGESIPVYKSIGGKVNAGTINSNGTLTVRAEKVGDETIISEIVRLVEQASGSKAPISRLADKISGIFVPVVIGIAFLTFLIWMMCGSGFEFAFSRAICVLVISCPCALGLATPVAVTVGTGVAASNGILIKNAATLEELGRINAVLFDKTGTLTVGNPVVTDIITAKHDDESFLSECASIERLSEHPLGKAIVKEAEARKLSITEAESFEAIPGMGLRAIMKGKTYYGGNFQLLDKAGITVNENIREMFKRLCHEGKTPLFFACDGELLGCIAVSDKPKDDSKAAIEKLNYMGIKTVMITGDNEITAEAIAGQIGIGEICASVSPSEKEEYVRRYQNSDGKVAMCGDGINDSPALARANVGISVSKGTDIALETSDVILMHSDVYSVPRAIALSKATISNIKLSLFWALLYNSLGIPIAAGVLYPAFGIVLNPMIGAAAMSLSSICVVLNALRLKKFKFD